MPIVACLICKIDFYVKPSQQKRGWGKFCSINCRSRSQYKGKDVRCFICNKEIYRAPKDLKNSKSNKFFCGKSCQTIWRNQILFSGENHANWKHGRSAYRRILKASGKVQICNLCGIKDIRVLAVHHKDKNRKNNAVGNLIWLCHNCHYLIHHYINELDKLIKQENMVAVVQK